MKRIAAVALACSLTLPVWAKDIASVNGQGIPQEKFDQFVSMLVAQGAQDTPQLRAQAGAVEDDLAGDLAGRVVDE